MPVEGERYCENPCSTLKETVGFLLIPCFQFFNNTQLITIKKVKYKYSIELKGKDQKETVGFLFHK